MVYFIFYLFLFLFIYFLHWVMSLKNYENGVMIVKRLRTTALDLKHLKLSGNYMSHLL
jgi:hypothetical protein